MSRGVRDKEEILRQLRAHSERIRALGVAELRLFGSFLRQEQRPDSDVDLLVRFAPNGKSYDRFLALATLLEEILQRPVELVTTESLSPYIGPRIEAEAEDVALGA